MTATMDRMAERTRLVGGKPTSLLDLGYNNVGLVCHRIALSAIASHDQRSPQADDAPPHLIIRARRLPRQDDNWQKCGTLNGQRAFHDADGNPLIDTQKFPSLSAMTAHGHSLGLRVGWYHLCGIRNAAGTLD